MAMKPYGAPRGLDPVKKWAMTPRQRELSRAIAADNAKMAERHAAERAAKKPKTEADLLEATKNFPMTVKFEGKTFSKTGKVGTDMKTGEPSAEYRSYGESGHEDDRVWRDASGKVARD